MSDKESSTPQWISRDQIADFVTEQGNPRNRRAARLLRIQTPNERLKDGLVLLDTPGAGGLNTAHTAITYAVLSSADVGIFVIDALTPLTVQELSMLETTAKLGARMLVVITKIDRVMDSSSAVSNAKAKLIGVLGPDLGASIPVIPVSSSAKLDWLRTGDRDSLAESNFEALEAVLWNLLGQEGGALLVGRALSRAITALNDVIAIQEAELVGLRSAEDEIHDAAGKLQEQRDHLLALAQPGAGWRRTLVDAFNAIRARTDGSLASQLATITARVDRQLAAGPKSYDEQAILSELERDVTVTWSGLLRDARGDVADLSDDIEAMTGLSVNPGISAGGKLTAFDSFGARYKSSERTSRMSGLEALGRIGEVIGWFDGSGVLFFVSQVVARFGIGSAKVKKQHQEFERNVRDLLGRAQLELQDRLTEIIDSAEGSITSSYEQLIRDRNGSVSAADRALRAGPGGSARLMQVEDSLSELTGLRDRVSALAGQLTAAQAPPVVA